MKEETFPFARSHASSLGLNLYLVQQAEDGVIVDQARNILDWGPSRPPEVHFAELCKGDLVHGEDLRYIAFPAMIKQLKVETMISSR